MEKTVFGSAAHFTGHISPAQSIEIHGEVNADIIADKLTLENEGKCFGNLDIKLGVFAGNYKGRMKAQSVWLLATARIFGQIEYQALQMDRGAALNCHILHNWPEENTLNEKQHASSEADDE